MTLSSQLLKGVRFGSIFPQSTPQDMEVPPNIEVQTVITTSSAALPYQPNPALIRVIQKFSFFPIVGRPFAVTICTLQVYDYPVKHEVFGVNRKEEETEPIHRFNDEGGSYGIEEMLIKAKGEERKTDIETKDHRLF